MVCIWKELLAQVLKLRDSGTFLRQPGSTWLWMVAWRSFVSKLCGCSSVRSCMGSSVSGTLSQGRSQFEELLG